MKKNIYKNRAGAREAMQNKTAQLVKDIIHASTDVTPVVVEMAKETLQNIVGTKEENRE